MDGRRLDGIARTIGESRSRREAVRVALAMSVGAALPWLASSPEEAVARRHACQIRCGGDRRLCKAECRRTGAFARQCKRDCRIWRDQCFQRCEFKPLGRRLAR